ncbi:hypothetical protein CDAR_112881 [Caerostris darwini]|uniref:Uncharacterized protein n=1 Tax=Caerostris darwini TaxID=1538125 RepID=A0AAV4PZ37_9ARAC|nr:hypothetical protein CDAR_112881 [Caerostris darwini]
MPSWVTDGASESWLKNSKFRLHPYKFRKGHFFCCRCRTEVRFLKGEENQRVIGDRCQMFSAAEREKHHAPSGFQDDKFWAPSHPWHFFYGSPRGRSAFSMMTTTTSGGDVFSVGHRCWVGWISQHLDECSSACN